MKIAIVSMEVKSGRCEENVMHMKEMIERAKQEQADMICFPMNAVSGYALGDAWKDDAWCRYVDSFNQQLIDLSDDIAIVWGNVKYRGKRLFNAAFFAYQKETYMRVRRHEDEQMFMDDHDFAELDINSAIDFHDEVFALNFGDEVQLADWNINLDAKPFDIHETKTIRGNVIYVNAVGMQNRNKAVVIMAGGSYVAKQSQICYQMEIGKAGYALIDTEQLTPCTEKQVDLCDVLACGIRGFDEQVLGGKAPWIVGLSGGLDSSVSAALLVYALGKERVLGYSMATKYNSDKTKNNARQVAENLGIPCKEGSIEHLVDATKDVLQEYGYPEVEGLALENIQARLRGHLLSSFASLHGGVVVNNGNKVENALGYCTLYGDAIGALGVLGDLTKVQLFDLAKQLNEKFKKEVVPNSLLPEVVDGKILWDVAPAAELKDGQVDPMKWFYHDYLVDHLGRDLSISDILQAYLNGQLLASPLGVYMRFYGLDDPEAFLKDLDWFLYTARRNQFKHLQVPAILSVSKNSYAFRKEVQGNIDQAYLKSLRLQIMNMKKQ